MSDQSPPLILIVEGEAAIAHLVSVLLGHVGYRALIAPDGTVARAMLKLLKFNLVALDQSLPGLSSQEVLAYVRTAPHTQGLPVLLLSAQSPSNAMRALVNAVLEKPFDVAGLLSAVEELVPAQHWLEAREVGG